MVLFESLALLGGLKDIFLYNRDIYMFNRELNQERIYHTQKMRIEQVLLYREDLRNLFDLTIGKMENYLVVNTLTLAFSMAFFYEGRMPTNTPTWLFWLWGMSLGTAVLFLIMSVWFAIYALITAQTFAVRLLTQWLRLPVPNQLAIAHATGTAEDFEAKPRSSLFRVPLVSKSGRSTGAGGSTTTHTTGSSSSSSQVPEKSTLGHTSEKYPSMVNPALENLFAKEYRFFVDHFYLFRYLQENWAGYDAYARVSMVVGTTQLLSTIGYMGVAWYVSEDSRWGGIVFTVLMMLFATIHARMNLLLSKKELIVVCFFIVGGPLIGCSAGIISYMQGIGYQVVAWLTPVCYFFHLCAIAFFIAIGSEKDGSLPTKFSTVISIDVLGLWESGKTFHDEEDHIPREASHLFQNKLGGYLVQPMRATAGALTGWQKQWLNATKREAPISQLIPPSMDAVQAEREKRLRPELMEEVIRGVAEGGDNGGVEDGFLHYENQKTTAEYDPKAQFSNERSAEFVPTKHITTLPWTSFRQAGALVILLWLVALGVSFWEAVTLTVPGWTRW